MSKKPPVGFCTLIVLCLPLCQVHAYTVLWDISHGYFSYDYVPRTSGGYYENLADDLLVNNFSIRTDLNFTPANLSLADVAVIAAPTVKTGTYNPAEVIALQSFVANGGGLLILADYNSNSIFYENVAQAFGISFGSAFSGNYTTNEMSTHPICEGIDSIEMFYGIGLELSDSAQSAITYSGASDETILAASAVNGSGRVIVISDSSLWSSLNNEDLYAAVDNQPFAMNVFEHLVDTDYVPEPATMLLLATGFWMMRKRR